MYQVINTHSKLTLVLASLSQVKLGGNSTDYMAVVPYNINITFLICPKGEDEVILGNVSEVNYKAKTLHANTALMWSLYFTYNLLL